MWQFLERDLEGAGIGAPEGDEVIYASWGKDVRLIAYCGIGKCSNCKNWTHFGLCEILGTARLYGIPIARYGKQHVLVCGTCERAALVDDSRLEAILKDTISLPTKEQCDTLWQEFLDAETNATLDHKAGTPESDRAFWLAMLAKVGALSDTHDKDHVVYVWQRFRAYLEDADVPD